MRILKPKMTNNNICPTCGSKGIELFNESVYIGKKNRGIYSSTMVFCCSLNACRNVFHGGISGND